MTELRIARAAHGLSAEITQAFVSLWTRYAGRRPAEARTEVRGNVVTCVMVDAAGTGGERTGASSADTLDPRPERPSRRAYRREAVAAIVRLTRQRVASFVSRYDPETDVETEVFTLEPSLNRGNPRLPGRESTLDPGVRGR